MSFQSRTKTIIQATLFTVALFIQSCTTTSDVEEEDASLYERMETFGDIDSDTPDAYPWLSANETYNDAAASQPQQKAVKQHVSKKKSKRLARK